MKIEHIINFLNENWDNLMWDGMEAVLYRDGDNWTRQQGSTGTDENDIVYKLQLGYASFGDSYVTMSDGETLDDDMKDDYVADYVREIKEHLAVNHGIQVEN